MSATLHDRLTGALIGLARATEGNEFMLSDSTAAVTLEALRATAPGAAADDAALRELLARVDGEKRKLVPMCYQCAASCGRTNDYDMSGLLALDEEVRALKLRLLDTIRSAAAHVRRNEEVHKFFYRALYAVGMDDWGREELLPILREAEALSRR